MWRGFGPLVDRSTHHSIPAQFEATLGPCVVGTVVASGYHGHPSDRLPNMYPIPMAASAAPVLEAPKIQSFW